MKIKILIVIPLLLLLTGCYNYKDLNNLAIVSGISIVYNNNKFEVSVEIVNPSLNDNNSRFVIYKSSDSSIQEAIRKISYECPKQLYLSHMNVLIIGEDVSKDYLSDILDFFARNTEIRSEFYVLIGKDKDILTITTPLEKLSSESIMNSLKVSHNYLGYTNLVTFQDLLDVYLNPHQELAISSIDVLGDIDNGDNIDNIKNTIQKTNSIISGIAVFKNNHLIGYLNEEDSLVYNIVTGKVNNYLIKVENDHNKYFVCEVIDEDTDVLVKFHKRKIIIKIQGNVMLSETNGNFNNNLESIMNLYLENMIYNSLKRVISKYHSDIYGFQNILYLKNQDVVRNLNRSWNDYYLETFDFRVISKLKIVQKGNLNGGVNS